MQAILNVLIILLLATIAAAGYLRKERRQRSQPQTPELDPIDLSPGRIAAQPTQTSAASLPIGECQATWEDNCAEGCTKTWRITSSHTTCPDTTGTMYAKDHVEKCYIFEPAMLGQWITKSPYGHMFALKITPNAQSCNVMQASCAYFDGSESGTFLKFNNSTTLKYIVDTKEIEYKLPQFIKSAIGQSKYLVKREIPDFLKMRWTAGGWQCDALKMQLPGSTMGKLVKPESTNPADVMSQTQVYKQFPRTDVGSKGSYAADGSLNLRILWPSATVTFNGESASLPIESSGLSKNDYQLMKVTNAQTLKLLQRINTNYFNAIAYNAAIRDWLDSGKLTMKLYNGDKNIAQVNVNAARSQKPPIDIESWRIDVTSQLVPPVNTFLKRAPNGKLSSVQVGSLRMTITSDEFDLIKDGQKFVVSIKTGNDVYQNIKPLKTQKLFFVPGKVGAYIPLQIKTGSFKIGSRPTLEMFAAQPAALRFAPRMDRQSNFF